MDGIKKTAAVFGASGLVGEELVDQLIGSDYYSKILVFNRRSMKYQSSLIQEIIIDFEQLSQIEDKVLADDMFCCIGTTMKKAGSKTAFEKVDYEIPLWLAKTAEKNKIKKLLIVSSVGADFKSSNFYLRTKGKMEQEVFNFRVPRTYFFRPSMLLGDRNENRLAEELGQKFMKIFDFLMIGKLKKYKAIPAKVVANAMINVAKGSFTQHFYESDEIWNLSDI